ncbi:hypothetical protein SAMN02910264_02316 [Ruminococcaceae bacterium YAD3003]|nr:hypothetical protein SAMN02910264_02316 [Ruminococcaceae bacterium YAD3003]
MSKQKSIKDVGSEPSNDKKTEYLQMIQEPICRMSTISAIFKGFAATIVAGISTLSYSGINVTILILSFIPVLAFACMDTYYLILEKKYRYLYEQVRSGKHRIDFSMDLTNNRKLAKARIIDCVFSPSILLFYPFMVLILVVVIVLKIKETI